MQQKNTDEATGIQVEVHGGIANVAKTINIYSYAPTQPEREIPFQALALPKDYIDRPQERQAVKAKLLCDLPETPGTLVVSAIYGLGGIGKSVMASALAHDSDVQASLPDGVLWVTLGQNPDLLPCLSGWIQALGDYHYKPTSIGVASAHLRTLLYDKKMLLVVDDAWSPEHVEPFRVGGKGCCVLVTTREAYVPDATRHDMDVMASDQSLELLLKKAQEKNPSSATQQYAQALVDEMGGVPLALELAGAQIADGVIWEELLSDFKKEVDRLELLNIPSYEGVSDDKTRKRMSLTASFNLSLKLLSSDQLQQFAWLGVLPEDVSIQSEMAATLWQVTKRQAGKILRLFRSKALLLSGLNQPNQQPTFRVHDLMHDLAKSLLVSKGNEQLEGLNLPFAEAHQIFLGYYQEKIEENSWHTLPGDGYIHAHLTWHMEQAEQPGLIHQLLQETTLTGSNGWYEVCDALGLPAIFVTDLGRAWKFAKKLYPKDALRSVVFQIHYALIFASLKSLIGNIPAELMAALVARHQWSPFQSLAYARQAIDSGHRSRIVQELARYLPSVVLPAALEMARNIEDERFRTHALSGLAPHLPEDLLSDALKMARSIRSESSRAHALSGLAPHLPEDLLSDALEMARSIESERFRALALSVLSLHLPEVVAEALEVVRSIQSESDCAFALGELSPYLPEGLLRDALEMARSNQSESDHADTLSELSPHLPEAEAEALEMPRSNQSECSRADVLSVLWPHLPEAGAGALEMARSFEDLYSRPHVLSELSPYLPGAGAEALAVAHSFQSERSRAYALSELAPHLSEDLLSDALEMVRGIQDESSRAHALSGLAPHLSEDLLSDALKMARSIRSESSRAHALSGLVPHLPGVVAEALEVACSIESEPDRSRALCELVPHLPEDLLSDALEAARSIQPERYCSDVLRVLLLYLPGVVAEALEVARSIESEPDRAYALCELVPHLPECLLRDALEVAYSIRSELSRTFALSGLVSYLPGVVAEALEAACSIESEPNRSRALCDLVPHLPEDLLSDALEAACSIESEPDRSRALCELVPHLPEDLLSDALEAARSIQSERYCSNVLRVLLLYLPGVVAEALEVARSIESGLDRAIALSGLAPHLPEVVAEALEVVCSIQDESDRACALCELVPHLSEDLLSNALEMARSIQDESSRAFVLRVFSPHLSEDLLSDTLEMARSIQDESSRADALGELSPYLPEGLLSDALEMARSIQDESSRADALRGLIPYLTFTAQDSSQWSEILHDLACQGRKNLLENIPKLAPSIIELGGGQALPLVVKSMREVCQQWP